MYLYIIERTPNNYSASLPDLPGVGATDATKEGLHKRISEALTLHLYAMREDGDVIPAPKGKPEDIDLELGEAVAWVESAPMNPVSLELRKWAADCNLSQSEIARRLGKTQASVARLFSPFYYGHSVTTLRELAAVLGAEVSVKLEPLDRAA